MTDLPDGALYDGGSHYDSGNPYDGGTQNDSGQPPGQCVPSCSSDVDCQNSCPAVPNGINCCDTATGICYANASTVCPAPVDAGFD